jgi:hypothetical protein
MTCLGVKSGDDVDATVIQDGGTVASSPQIISCRELSQHCLN